MHELLEGLAPGMFALRRRAAACVHEHDFGGLADVGEALRLVLPVAQESVADEDQQLGFSRAVLLGGRRLRLPLRRRAAGRRFVPGLVGRRRPRRRPLPSQAVEGPLDRMTERLVLGVADVDARPLQAVAGGALDAQQAVHRVKEYVLLKLGAALLAAVQRATEALACVVRRRSRDSAHRRRHAVRRRSAELGAALSLLRARERQRYFAILRAMAFGPRAHGDVTAQAHGTTRTRRARPTRSARAPCAAAEGKVEGNQVSTRAQRSPEKREVRGRAPTAALASDARCRAATRRSATGHEVWLGARLGAAESFARSAPIKGSTGRRGTPSAGLA
eukprot:scaffold1220_cov259-Pinguiococcus_pyrenoidosus.AAC.109